MTEEETDIQDFEEAFEKGKYSIRFSLVAQKADVVSLIKDWMWEIWLASRKSLREENEKLKMIVEKQHGYNRLLIDEINDLVGLAVVHGWQSTRYEQGKKFRNELDRLRGETPDEELKRIPGLVEKVQKRYNSLVKVGKIIP